LRWKIVIASGVMKAISAFTVALALASVGFAQNPEDALREKIAGVRYAPIAAAAQVQGDVRLRIDSGKVTFLSGPPLLAGTAIESAKAFGSTQGEANLDVTYHFALMKTAEVPTSTIVRRGDAFDRVVLRVLGIRTEKVVVDHQCQKAVPPANIFKVAGTVIEVWIYGSAGCLMTSGYVMVPQRG
jgi:hypothetical protein